MTFCPFSVFPIAGIPQELGIEYFLGMVQLTDSPFISEPSKDPIEPGTDIENPDVGQQVTRTAYGAAKKVKLGIPFSHMAFESVWNVDPSIPTMEETFPEKGAVQKRRRRTKVKSEDQGPTKKKTLPPPTPSSVADNRVNIFDAMKLICGDREWVYLDAHQADVMRKGVNEANALEFKKVVDIVHEGIAESVEIPK